MMRMFSNVADNRMMSVESARVMSCLCEKCAALCCRYFALPLDNPETVEDYDNIRWYLMHENVVVFIEKKQWYIGIMSRCKHLQNDNRCGIYNQRPRVCRSYSSENCEYHGGEYEFDVLFTSAQQLREYAEKKLKRSLVARSVRNRKRSAGMKHRKGVNGHPVLSLPLMANARLSAVATIAKCRWMWRSANSPIWAARSWWRCRSSRRRRPRSPTFPSTRGTCRSCHPSRLR
jgi:Fe-S-cluster containining protein